MSRRTPGHDVRPSSRLRSSGRPAQWSVPPVQPVAVSAAPVGRSCGPRYLAEPTRALRDRLVVHYTPLVRAVAHRVGERLCRPTSRWPTWCSPACSASSTRSSGSTLRGARGSRATPRQRIRGAILDELRAQDWVPRTVRGRVRELERAQERLEARLPARRHRARAGRRARPAGAGAARARPAGPDDQRRGPRREQRRRLGAARRRRRARPDGRGAGHARRCGSSPPAVEQLGERDRTVVRLYYLENRTLAEIGRLLGRHRVAGVPAALPAGRAAARAAGGARGRLSAALGPPGGPRTDTVAAPGHGSGTGSSRTRAAAAARAGRGTPGGRGARPSAGRPRRSRGGPAPAARSRRRRGRRHPAGTAGCTGS